MQSVQDMVVPEVEDKAQKMISVDSLKEVMKESNIPIDGVQAKIEEKAQDQMVPLETVEKEAVRANEIVQAKQSEIQSGIPDVWVYRIVTGSLGLIALMVVASALVLTIINGDQVPQIFIAIGSAAVGALAGLIAPFSRPRAS